MNYEIIFRLNKTINDVSKACTNENGNRHSPLLEKQTEMNELYSAVELAAQDKQNQLHDVLKEVLKHSFFYSLYPCTGCNN